MPRPTNHMNETKSVKVDNWGVFFLQKLQNFFNKTDHCDLTLQFDDNSQLKVHRLVLNACTDYFNMLEETCEMIDNDLLLMPIDLQADVIVPIVNFMYTGTLEFQYNMYEKLLKTAKDMNMTVLLKLLEAHRQTTVQQTMVTPKPPVLLNKQAPNRGAGTTISGTMTRLNSSGRATYGLTNKNTFVKNPPQPPTKIVYKHHQTTIAPLTKYMTVGKGNIPEPLQLVNKYSHAGNKKSGPSRFEVNDEEGNAPETFDTGFSPISYESKPLLTAEQIKKEEEAFSPFDKIKKEYKGPLKRPAPTASGRIISPPSKKPNLEDVKELTEATRLRKEFVREDDYEEDEDDDLNDLDYDADTNYNNDDDDDDQPLIVNKKNTVDGQTNKTKLKSYSGANTSTTTTTSIKTAGNSTKQITVKDESSGSVNHAKIISEVLKKYPHLVKNNKNIKLKIMQKPNQSPLPTTTASVAAKPTTSTPAPISKKSPVAKPPIQKSSSSNAHQTVALKTEQPARKIDAKTMHALIAKGPENMTGPWLCLDCGINGRPISIPSYKTFRRHLTNVHKVQIDHRICEHCGFRAKNRHFLLYHIYCEHNIKPPSELKLHFPKCAECNHIAISDSALQKHYETDHREQDDGEEQQECMYCNKIFDKEGSLYNHLRSQHRNQAVEDGVIECSDEGETFEDEDDAEGYIPNDPTIEESSNVQSNTSPTQKIKIISNITLGNSKNPILPFVIDSSHTGHENAGKQNKLERSSEAEALSNVASGIATSLGVVMDDEYVASNDEELSNQYLEDAIADVHGEYKHNLDDKQKDVVTKLISEDGSEIELTQAQKDEIISQLQNQNANENVVMVLNDDAFNTAITSASSSNTHNDQNIVVVYSESGDLMKTNNIKTTAANISTTSREAILSVLDDSVGEELNNSNDGEKNIEDDTIIETSSIPEDNKNDSVEDDSAQQQNDEIDEINQVIEQVEEEEDEEEEEEICEAEEEEDVGEQSTKNKKLNKADEEAAKADKLKLITELEGDWPDEEEELNKTEEDEEEVHEEEQSDVSIKEDINSSIEVDNEAEKINSNEEDKKIANLFDEWIGEDDDSQNTEKHFEEIEIKKENEVMKEMKNEDIPESKDNSNGIKDGKKNEKKDKSTTKTVEISVNKKDENVSKTTNELSTLIDDWDDDDHDL